MSDRDLWPQSFVKEANSGANITVDVSADLPEGATSYYLVWMAQGGLGEVSFDHTYDEVLQSAAGTILNFDPGIRFLASAGDLTVSSSQGTDWMLGFVVL